MSDVLLNWITVCFLKIAKKKDDTMAEKITRIFQVLHFKPFLNCIYFSKRGWAKALWPLTDEANKSYNLVTLADKTDGYNRF